MPKKTRDILPGFHFLTAKYFPILEVAEILGNDQGNATH